MICILFCFWLVNRSMSNRQDNKQDKESNTNANANAARSAKPRLSSRGGALILRSLSLFLARSSRGKPPQLPLDNATPKKCNHSRRTMNSGNSKTLNKYTACLLDSLRKDTHFSKDEIEALYKIYRKLVISSKMNMMYIHSGTSGQTAISKTSKIQEGVDRIVFQELLHNTFDLVTEDTLMDRIFYAWDKNNEGLLKVEMWISGLSMFLRGKFDEKIEYCFRVYDLNSDGYISKDEIFQLLKNCLVKQPQEEDPDEGVKDLVEIILRKLDTDRDGKVSFEDYKAAITNEPLLLEAFGQCLPTEGSCITFLSTLHV